MKSSKTETSEQNEAANEWEYSSSLEDHKGEYCGNSMAGLPQVHQRLFTFSSHRFGFPCAKLEIALAPLIVMLTR